jgi:nucleotide-binding universal stress UspA family protein
LISQARRRDKLRETKAGQYIQGKLGEIQAQGVSASSQIAAGDPSEAILDFCRKENIDLVVMTTSGKSGIRRDLVGSVADTLIGETGIPVLVVRPGKN